jgi:hypothetical protein
MMYQYNDLSLSRTTGDSMKRFKVHGCLFQRKTIEYIDNTDQGNLQGTPQIKVCEMIL